MAEPLVTIERHGAVAAITLNRPARHNALVPGLLTELLESLKGEPIAGAGALVLAAEGRSFSTGGDLLGFHEHRDTIGEYAEQLVGLLNDVILALYDLPLAAVCAVNGQVCGGSLGLLLGCGRVVMQRDASVTPWYGAVGFSPDGGWTAMLPDIIGARPAAQWLADNARHDAARCLDLGLADQVVDTDAMAAALAWASEAAITEPGSAANARSRRHGDSAGLAGRLAAEKREFVRQVRTAEARRGIERYLAGSPPQ